MKLSEKPYTLPDGKPFTEENYWRYIIKDLPRPWDYEPMPKKQREKRVLLQTGACESTAALRPRPQAAKKAKAKRRKVL